MQNRKYILGDLSDSDRERIDDLLLQDDSAYDEMLAEEDDLIDAYVRRELGGDELRAFEAAVRRSARLRERLDLARVIHSGMSRALRPPQQIPTSTRAWYALAAAIAVVSLVGVWALTKSQSAPRETPALEAAKRRPPVTRATQQQPIASSASATQPPAPRTVSPPKATVRKVSPIVPVSIVTIVLSGAATRGDDEMLRYNVPSEAREVEFDVNLDGETARLFNAVLRDTRGREVWSQHDRPMAQLQSGQGIEVRVPARKLEGGRYELGVYDARSGDEEPVSFIEFAIVRK